MAIKIVWAITLGFLRTAVDRLYMYSCCIVDGVIDGVEGLLSDYGRNFTP